MNITSAAYNLKMKTAEIMVRNLLLRNGCKYGITPMFFTSLFGTDNLDKVTETEKNADMSIMKEETGWDRLKRIFQLDEFGNVSIEANSVLQVAAMSSFVGAIYGGVIHSRKAYMEFMENNQATKFQSHLEAKQKLQDKVTISFGKGAFKWAWRLSLFSSIFIGTSTAIQTYRGKSGILEYVAAGSIAGSMYKFNMGPRGWIVGGGLGCVLGLFCGSVTLGLMNLTGVSMEEARYWQNYWKSSRSEYFRKGVADYLEKEDFALIKLHNDEIGDVGKDITNLDENVDSSNNTNN